MRFMLMFRPVDHPEDEAPPCRELEEMGHMIEKLRAEGTLLATEGLHGSARGARVKLANQSYTITDGPFTEAKELVAGFALVDVASKEAAVELAKRILAVSGEGQSDVREVIE